MMAWQPGWFQTTQPATGWLVVHSGQSFLSRGTDVLFAPDDPHVQGLAGDRHGLGLWQDQPVTLLELDSPPDIEGCAWQPLRPLMLQSPHALFKLLGYANQIGTWARQHRFCGQCGTGTFALDGQRGLKCPNCQLTQYPRLSPSMIALITRGDEVLLARSPRFAPGVFSTLAGFVEPGESAEACVHREIMEEVGVTVGNLRYQGSQNWPYPHSLMLGYHVDYLDGDIRCQPEEIEDARWFHLNELPTLPPSFSISRYLIDLYRVERLGGTKPVLPD